MIIKLFSWVCLAGGGANYSYLAMFKGALITAKLH